MSFKDWSIDVSLRRPKLITWVMVLSMFGISAIAAIPNFVDIPFLNKMIVDTDPENMLSYDEPVRVTHRDMKKQFNLPEMAVVGVVNEEHPDGVFNPETLANILKLTDFARNLRWEEDGKQHGIIEADMIAPSMVDNMEQGGLGVVTFSWLMKEAPKTAEEARAIGERAARLPFLNGTMVSEDRKSIMIFLPLTSKHVSHRVYNELLGKIKELNAKEKYMITGLPMAEDVFGVEMFMQMGISGPVSMMMLFFLLLIFFRKLNLVLAPMIIANVAVMVTMGMLIICGYPVHVLNSLIPIFIMPISVLDAVHILSEFYDRYQKTRDREKTIKVVMDELFTPMLFTSLTTAAGFGSLIFTPIPPVQVFGAFVAIGVMAAWLATVTFMPAYIMMINPAKLEKFGAVHAAAGQQEGGTGLLPRLLHWTGRATYSQAKLILALSLVVLAVAGYGLTKLVVNDNPIKWFGEDHPIRVADEVLNQHFGGTHEAFFALSARDEKYDSKKFLADLTAQGQQRAEALKAESPQVVQAFADLQALAAPAAERAQSRTAALEDLAKQVKDKAAQSGDPTWEHVGLFLDTELQKSEVMKDPVVLRYIEQLQAHMLKTNVVGKSNSLADMVKTVHRDLLLGEQAQFRIPDNSGAVAQTLLTFQTGHRPHDLWHFVTPDYRSTSIWIQLKSGDNKDMSELIHAMAAFTAANPPPHNLKTEWFGLTYLNVIWQDKMVVGMLQAFLGSFFIVFLMMAWMLRSALWGFLSMLPLTLTIVAIYGVVGLVGKAYDMPVAVLSSLALGLAVDFAIHFLARAQAYRAQYGSWEAANAAIFGEPARAITRNIIVVALGFTPLLLAPLTPYNTVGMLLASILLVSGVSTLLLMPALVRVLEKWLFSPRIMAGHGGTRWGLAGSTGISVGGTIALTLASYTDLTAQELTGLGAAIAVVVTIVTYVVMRMRSPDAKVEVSPSV
ncbi:efflux RND transporter permease subunit [Hyalangium sp.]|uniref:efflux RND transporter permease subunit n=1 Tax=Hyalangium sp. TaxID=2028555 RepID=UPI002D646192|nr:MMPL family transporter [Hyalangium sp.]HYH95624.1 MMPL family transporter [Hyalangium sp.]